MGKGTMGMWLDGHYCLAESFYSIWSQLVFATEGGGQTLFPPKCPFDNPLLSPLLREVIHPAFQSTYASQNKVSTIHCQSARTSAFHYAHPVLPVRQLLARTDRASHNQLVATLQGTQSLHVLASTSLSASSSTLQSRHFLLASFMIKGDRQLVGYFAQTQ